MTASDERIENLGKRTRRSFLCVALGGSVTVLAACTQAPPAPSIGGNPTTPLPNPTTAQSPVAGPSVGASPSTATVSQAAPAPISPPLHLRATSTLQLATAGFYIALSRNYFKDEGLDVEPVSGFRNAADQLAPLISGDIAFGVAGPGDPAVFNAIQRGIPVQFVASASVVAPNDRSSGFVARQDLLDSGRYKELKDLKGLKIGLNALRTGIQRYLDLVLQKAGLQESDVDITTLDLTDMPAALAGKSVDVVFEFEPFITTIQAQGTGKLIEPVGDFDVGTYGTVITISPVFAQQQPEAARRYVTGFVRGVRDYHRAFDQNADPALRQDLIQILATNTTLKDVALYDRVGLPFVDPNCGIDERIIDAVEDYYILVGAQLTKVPAASSIDLSYLDYALQRLGRVT